MPTAPHLAPTPPESVLLPRRPTRTPRRRTPSHRSPPRARPTPRSPKAPTTWTRAPPTRKSRTIAHPAAVAEVRQSAGPAAPAYDDVEREAVLKVMRERRDIRNGFPQRPHPARGAAPRPGGRPHRALRRPLSSPGTSSSSAPPTPAAPCTNWRCVSARRTRSPFPRAGPSSSRN
ncbi:hypothetical protein LV779_16455 [Streptomyces thinghirensis]|nr:hypothetical protein [Streptomyces thinghirensis]